jgi:16S rRNA (cytosine967-C5)-methyltransferase
MTRPRSKSTVSPGPGLAARRIAADILEGITKRRRPLDELFDTAGLEALEDERDRALVRAIVATSVRRLGTLRHLLVGMLERGLPPNVPRVESALLIGAAQILFLDVPDHAAVDLSVQLVQDNRFARHYTPLVNALLRKMTREGKARLAAVDTIALDTPEWLMQRWQAHYGEALARAIAAANAQEPALDLSVKSEPQRWAERLNGRVLPTGSIRLIAQGPVPNLPGFDEGEWWVQDAAAALPVRLLGDIAGKAVADLCAAPGGKTAQLAVAGARVTAVDRSRPRLDRLQRNLDRLGLQAEIVQADATQWQAGPFDAILLDAPCLATGTIRRHPDIPWLKSRDDLSKLSALQARLADHAATLLRPGGTMIYCTCSLEPEEGEHLVASLLQKRADLRRRPISAAEVGRLAEVLTPDGDLRSLPCHLPDPDRRWSGLDGFYAARIDKL